METGLLLANAPVKQLINASLLACRTQTRLVSNEARKYCYLRLNSWIRLRYYHSNHVSFIVLSLAVIFLS